jgi:hypothetical protein
MLGMTVGRIRCSLNVPELRCFLKVARYFLGNLEILLQLSAAKYPAQMFSEALSTHERSTKVLVYHAEWNPVG